MKKFLFVSAVLVGLMSFGAALSPEDFGCKDAKATIDKGGALELGQWYTDWNACKTYADANNLPVLFIWSNKTCVHCEWTERVFVHDTFKTWAANNDAGKVIYCFMAGGESMYPDQRGSAAYSWMYEGTGDGGGTKLNVYPFVCLWWKAKGVNARNTGDDLCSGNGFNASTHLDADSLPQRIPNVIEKMEIAFGGGKPSPKVMFALGNAFGCGQWVGGGALIQTAGEDLEEPEIEGINGWEFVGWSVEDLWDITEPTTVYAQYDRENKDGSLSMVRYQDGRLWQFCIRDDEAILETVSEEGWSTGGCVTDPQPVGPLAIPAELNDYPVVGIGDFAFAFCDDLTAVTIPESVSLISSFAFAHCCALETVTFEGDKDDVDIASYAFRGTPYEASLPFSLVVEDDVVVGFKGLVPDNLVIPEGVVGIEEGAFSGAFSAYDEDGNRRSATISFPSTLEWIGSYAFESCSGLRELNFPEGLEYIGEGAFAYCAEECEDEDFWGFVGLESVFLPQSLIEIGEEAFVYCRALESVTFAGDEDAIETGRAAFQYTPFERDRPFRMIIWDGVVTGMHGTAPMEVTIPEGVTAIGEYAFAWDEHCSWGRIQCLTLPASMEEIGEGAFYETGLRHVFLTGLGEVDFETLSDVCDVDESAFDAAKGKKSILPNGVPVKAVDASSGKWTLPKAGKVAFAKGTQDLDESKFTAKNETDPNPAALKLTFKKKTGLFSGTFQFYQLSGGKLKKLKAAVNGAVVDGKGYGSATVKNMGAVPVTVGK